MPYITLTTGLNIHQPMFSDNLLWVWQLIETCRKGIRSAAVWQGWARPCPQAPPHCRKQETVVFQAVPWPQRLLCTGCFGHCLEIEERFCILVQQHPLSRTTHKSQTDAQLTPQNKKNDSLQTHQRKTEPREQGAYYNRIRKSRPENLRNTLDWGKSVVPLAGLQTEDR